jgi:hypothetical protein
MNRSNQPHKTAVHRSSLSAPARYLSEQGLLVGRVLDYGCGHGFDADTLGLDGYDPHYRPRKPRHKYNVIMCNFVLNVLPTARERRAVLDAILALLRKDGVAYVTVRNDREELKGWTATGTWQGLVCLPLPVVKACRGWVMYRHEN